MPDWQHIVRTRLSGIALEEDDSLPDVVEELASHLEEQYQSLLGEGIPEQTAIHRVLQQVTDWHDLKSRIESSREKEPSAMTNRVSQFWFPSFLTILLSMSFLMIIQQLGPKPWVSPAWGGPPRMAPVAVVYFSWLVTLPLVGALGAYLSKRAGARYWAVFFSVIFPTFPYLAFFTIGLPISAMLDDHVAHNITFPAFLVGFGAWVFLPAIALLAGGLPVHYFPGRKALA